MKKKRRNATAERKLASVFDSYLRVLAKYAKKNIDNFTTNHTNQH